MNRTEQRMERVPEAFIGAWTRRSVTIGDGEPHEPLDVIWIQAGREFCDLRMPVAEGAVARSFAGFSTWEEPYFTWHHELDTMDVGSPDRGEISWDGATLIERGVSMTLDPSGPVPYAEVYDRLPGSAGSALALRMSDEDGRTRGLAVQVGSHRLVIVDDRPAGGEYLGCYSTRSEGGWAPKLTLGSAESIPALPDSLQDHPVGASLTLPERNEIWRVVERTGPA